MAIVLDRRRKASVREKIRAASTQGQNEKRKRSKTKNSFYFRNEEPVDRKRKRRYQREKTRRYQSVRKVKQAGVLPFLVGSTKRNPLSIIGTHQNAHQQRISERTQIVWNFPQERISDRTQIVEVPMPQIAKETVEHATADCTGIGRDSRGGQVGPARSALPSSLRMRLNIRKRPSRLWRRSHMNEWPNRWRMRFNLPQKSSRRIANCRKNGEVLELAFGKLLFRSVFLSGCLTKSAENVCCVASSCGSIG